MMVTMEVQMKLLISALFLLSNLVFAEVWVKPKYMPDENHLPDQAMEKQEERMDKGVPTPKQHQEEKKQNTDMNTEETTEEKENAPQQ